MHARRSCSARTNWLERIVTNRDSFRLAFVVTQIGTAKYIAPFLDLNRKSGLATIRVLSSHSVHEYFNSCRNLAENELIHIENNGVEAVVREFRPHKLVTSLAYHEIEQRAVIIARQENILSAGILDTWYDYRRRLYHSNPDCVLPDHILMNGRDAVAEALSTGVDRTLKLVPVGHPWLEQIKYSPPDSISLPALFIGQPVNRKNRPDIGYSESEAFNLVNKALNGKVVYSRHPTGENPPGINPAGTALTETSLDKFSLVTGMYSTLMQEAYLSGRYVISLQPGFRSKNMCYLSRKRYIPLARTQSQLVRYIKNPEITSPYRFSNQLKGSLDRLARFLVDR